MPTFKMLWLWQSNIDYDLVWLKLKKNTTHRAPHANFLIMFWYPNSGLELSIFSALVLNNFYEQYFIQLKSFNFSMSVVHQHFKRKCMFLIWHVLPCITFCSSTSFMDCTQCPVAIIAWYFPLVLLSFITDLSCTASNFDGPFHFYILPWYSYIAYLLSR